MGNYRKSTSNPLSPKLQRAKQTTSNKQPSFAKASEGKASNQQPATSNQKLY